MEKFLNQFFHSRKSFLLISKLLRTRTTILFWNTLEDWGHNGFCFPNVNKLKVGRQQRKKLKVDSNFRKPPYVVINWILSYYKLGLRFLYIVSHYKDLPSTRSPFNVQHFSWKFWLKSSHYSWQIEMQNIYFWKLIIEPSGLPDSNNRWDGRLG